MEPVLQLSGIFAGSIIAVVTLLCSVYAWDSNRRQQDTQRQFREAREDMQRQFQEAREDMQRRFQEAREDMQRRFQEAREDRQLLREDMQRLREDMQRLREDMQQQFQQVREENRREHLEILRVIAQHLHIEDGRVVVPVGDADPTGTPAPADN